MKLKTHFFTLVSLTLAKMGCIPASIAVNDRHGCDVWRRAYPARREWITRPQHPEYKWCLSQPEDSPEYKGALESLARRNGFLYQGKIHWVADTYSEHE